MVTSLQYTTACLTADTPQQRKKEEAIVRLSKATRCCSAAKNTVA